MATLAAACTPPESKNTSTGFVVFSEMHYPKGWKSYLDGQEAEHINVNYALRGMKVPEGNHQIEFRFEPEVVATGSKISLGSSIALGLIIIGGVVFSFWNSRRKSKD